MNIVRYQRYPQTDLSATLDRLTNMRDELDQGLWIIFRNILPTPWLVKSVEPCCRRLSGQ